MTKICRKCKIKKPIERFHKDHKRADGYYPWCADCKNERERITSKTPERRRAVRNRVLLYRYGITEQQLDRLYEQQDGECALCDSPGAKPMTDALASRWETLCIDHDHSCCKGERSCGKCVRGLLCVGCNLGLVAVDKNPVILDRIPDYLGR